MFGKSIFIESLKRVLGLSMPQNVAIKSPPASTIDRSERPFICGNALHWGEEARLQKVAEELREAQKNPSAENSVSLDKYRDDRMFIMRLSSGFKHDDDGSIVSTWELPSTSEKTEPMLLLTYRNTEPLKPVQADNFASLAEALAYIRKIEPSCPRLSLGGHAPDPTPSWQEHLAWLKTQGFSTAAIGE